MDKENEEIEETNGEAKEEVEQLDFTKPDFVFTPNENHGWKQQGPYVICKSCEIEHAVFIGMDKLLTGLDQEGKPILRAR